MAASNKTEPPWEALVRHRNPRPGTMATAIGAPANQMWSCRKRGVDSTPPTDQIRETPQGVADVPLVKGARTKRAPESARSVPARLATGEQGANRTTGQRRDSAQHRWMRDFLAATSLPAPCRVPRGGNPNSRVASACCARRYAGPTRMTLAIFNVCAYSIGQLYPSFFASRPVHACPQMPRVSAAAGSWCGVSGPPVPGPDPPRLSSPVPRAPSPPHLLVVPMALVFPASLALAPPALRPTLNRLALAPPALVRPACVRHRGYPPNHCRLPRSDDADPLPPLVPLSLSVLQQYGPLVPPPRPPSIPPPSHRRRAAAPRGGPHRLLRPAATASQAATATRTERASIPSTARCPSHLLGGPPSLAYSAAS